MNDRHLLPERPSIEPRWLFPLLDAVMVFAAFVLGYWLRYEWQIFRPVFDPRQNGFAPYLPFAVVYAGLLYFNYYNNGLYRNVRGRSWSEEVATIAGGVG